MQEQFPQFDFLQYQRMKTILLILNMCCQQIGLDNYNYSNYRIYAQYENLEDIHLWQEEFLGWIKFHQYPNRKSISFPVVVMEKYYSGI